MINLWGLIVKRAAKFGFVGLFLLLVVSGIAFFTLQVFAQTNRAGVSKGNIFIFDMSITWNSTNPTASVPDKYLEAEEWQYQWLSLKVTEVNGSEICLEPTFHFKNGTEETRERGRWAFYITPPNLSANETALYFSIYREIGRAH